MTEEVPPTALSEINLRLLCHDDIDTVKQLCGDWFPIEYVTSWLCGWEAERRKNGTECHILHRWKSGVRAELQSGDY